MDKAKNNIFLRWQMGAERDQIIIRRTSSGCTLIVNRPLFDSDNGFVHSSKSRQEAFRRASTYALFAQSQPIYEYKAMGTHVSAYDMAVADYFGKPQVLEIDISDWTGEAGQPIRIKARDNILVVSVRLIIRDNNTSNAAIEADEAVQYEDGSLLWTYTTSTLVKKKSGIRLDAFAYDLSGNVGASSLELN